MSQKVGARRPVLTSIYGIARIAAGCLVLLFFVPSMILSLMPFPAESTAPRSLTPIMVFERLSPLGWAASVALCFFAIFWIAIGLKQLTGRPRPGL
jgi:hypothetical protein